MENETNNSVPSTSAYQWPVFDSIGQAAQAIGVPAHLLKTAKRAGCPAFRSNRVFSEQLLRWALEQLSAGPDGRPAPFDPQQMRARVDLARARKIEFENAVSEKELIPASTIEQIVGPLGQQLRAAIMDMPERLAPQCNPDKHMVAHKVLVAYRDEFLETNHALFLRKWGFEPEKPYESPTVSATSPAATLEATNLPDGPAKSQ